MPRTLTPDELLGAARFGGNTTREFSGWRERGIWRLARGFSPTWITIHHTAGEANAGVERYISSILVADPAVPDKCTVAIDRSGTVWMVTAGRANHQLKYSDAGRRRTASNAMPIGGPSVALRGNLENGNSFSYGAECIAAGTPNAAQYAAATRWAAGMCKALGIGAGSVVGHGELASDRDFSDPGWPMGDFRAEVARLLLTGSPATPAGIAPPPQDLPAGDWWPLVPGKADGRVTQLENKLVTLGFDWHRAGPSFVPGPRMSDNTARNISEFLFAHGLRPELGYRHDGQVWPREFGAIMDARKPNIPAANFANPADGAAALWLKTAGIKAGLLDPAWPWARNGDRGFEWPRLVRRLQMWLGDQPDPESEDPAVCFIGPTQNQRLSQRLGLWDL
ncbi:hypothetical protein CGZ94_04970 [Enemella evansiae]|uniref:N-acetylmuramoyl-L-alanine amidase domain-containing protein n=1 Tax=Enemella evansiae TaxID=2016499 RepID=A0A255GKF1_9ACTN|nr:peptidoglycan recognition family protein [Enemella evansiae]OYO16295.1 hypothetical protein CGZ94_04970 [Enemella evansiae]